VRDELVSPVVTSKVREFHGEWIESGYGVLNYSNQRILV
jgi:hypothetical protein